MTMTWREFADDAPELAAAVRSRFEAARHHVLATLRADGAPRVSGTEVHFSPDLWIGSMPGAVKARDLQRDGRYAVHAHPGAPDGSSMTPHGDAKVSGVVVEVTEDADLESFRDEGVPPGPFHAFRLLLTDAVLTTVEGDQLVVRSWRAGRGTSEVRRT